MSENFNPARRRMLAGLAALGLAQPALGQTQATKPQCRINNFRMADFVNGSASVYYNSEYKKVTLANFNMRPTKTVEHGLTRSDIIFSHTNMKFTRANRDGSGKLLPDSTWREWTCGVAQLMTKDGGRKLNSLIVTIGDDQGLVFRTSNVFYKNSTGVLNDIKFISWSDTSTYYAKHSFVDWLKNRKSGKNLIVFAQDPGNPDLWVRYYYAKKDILKYMRQMDPKADKLRQDAANGDCTAITYGSGCFLTTAACGTVGLADDCWELRTLRRFRDGWLKFQPGGKQDIETYYNTAPGIVDAVSARPDATTIWLSVYWRHIVPSAIAARFGLRKTARRLYSAMMHRMAAFSE